MNRNGDGPDGAASANARPSYCEEASGPDGPRPQGESEAQDIMAFLRRRAANARAADHVMRGKDFGGEMDAMIADRRRQLEVLIGELEAGFHYGEAAVEAARKAKGTGDNHDG